MMHTFGNLGVEGVVCLNYTLTQDLNLIQLLTEIQIMVSTGLLVGTKYNGCLMFMPKKLLT